VRVTVGTDTTTMTVEVIGITTTIIIAVINKDKVYSFWISEVCFEGPAEMRGFLFFLGDFTDWRMITPI
jgi:hypothetical protein